MDDLDPDVRRVVHDGMREALPDARTEARVLAALLTRLPEAGSGALGPEGTSGPAIAGGATVSATWKAVLGVSLVTAAILAGTAAATRDKEEAATKAVAPKAAEVDPAPARRSSATPPIEAPSVPPIEPAPAGPVTPARTPTVLPRSPSKVVAEPPADDLAAETEIVAAADSALTRGDTARALALAAEHARRHPNGQLAVEREAITATAACLAKQPDAAAQAQRFLRLHPRSAAAAKVRARCGALAEIDEAE
jgi:hypothetical protein